MLKLTKTVTALPDAPVGSDAASVYRRLAMEMDTLKAELAIQRNLVMAQAMSERVSNPNYAGTVKLNTSDGQAVTVVWREQYRPLPIANKPVLLDAFGARYHRHVDEVSSVKLAPGVTLAAIMAAVRDSDEDAMTELLLVTDGVQPRKGSMEEVHILRTEGELEQASDLQSFINACATAPQLRVK